jgi:hypothetical protein
MDVSAAIEQLVGRLTDTERFSAAFRSARIARRRWPIADLLDFHDFDPDRGGRMPPPGEWVVEVDALGKPKSSGGRRVERLVDICTGTLLQAKAIDLQARLLRAPSAVGAPFGLRHGAGISSYEVWARAVATWLTQHLSKGLAVVTLDFADFFSSVRPAQIERALAELDVDSSDSRPLLALFGQINLSAARDGSTGKGLPTIPDDIAWVVADAVMRKLDGEIARNPLVAGYARWVDDCYIACDASRAERLLKDVADWAQALGLRLNPDKARVLRSMLDFDRAFLRREHELLGDLLAIRAAGATPEADLSRFSPALTPKGSRTDAEAARLVRRLFVLAKALHTPHLVAAAANYLHDFPGAERQILGYLGSLAWPDGSHELLFTALSDGNYDSRQLFALRLLLDLEPGQVPYDARWACARIVDGAIGAHDFARVLAFAVLMDDESGPRMRLRQRFSTEIGELRSAMARRVGLQLLFLSGSGVVDWAAQANDPSPLVRQLAAFCSRSRQVRRIAPASRRGWTVLQDRLMRRLHVEVQR